MTRRTLALAALLLLGLASPAPAEDEDLQKTITDLGSQTDDKEKMDGLGATKVELSQIRAWLNDATNAVKEEAEQKCRRLFELVRAQLKLIDELVALSKLEAEAEKLTAAIAQAEQKAQAAKRQLEEKQVQIRAQKLKDKQ